MAIAMTATRDMVDVDAEVMEIIAAAMFYVQASDGVWVPSCDIVQYESKRRFWA
jgi:translation initiation factor IF-1